MRLPSRIARPALVALFGALVAVTPGATQTSRPGLRATKTVLPDGLTVLVIENRTPPVVVVSLFVRSGTGRETDATSGISNLLQQVMVKGTASRSALALARGRGGDRRHHQYLGGHGLLRDPGRRARPALA